MPGILGWGKVKQNNINYEPLPQGKEVFPNRDRYVWGKMKSLAGYKQCWNMGYVREVLLMDKVFRSWPKQIWIDEVFTSVDESIYTCEWMQGCEGVGNSHCAAQLLSLSAQERFPTSNRTIWSWFSMNYFPSSALPVLWLKSNFCVVMNTELNLRK